MVYKLWGQVTRFGYWVFQFLALKHWASYLILSIPRFLLDILMVLYHSAMWELNEIMHIKN